MFTCEETFSRFHWKDGNPLLRRYRLYHAKHVFGILLVGAGLVVSLQTVQGGQVPSPSRGSPSAEHAKSVQFSAYSIVCPKGGR